MMTWLEHIDHQLFSWINSHHNGFLDWIMWGLSNKFTWIPIYLLLIYLLWKHFKVPTIFYVLLGMAFVILLADRGSVLLFKDFFQRYRPCHNLDLIETVRLPAGSCGGKFGFVSSHASNFFAIATYLFLLMRPFYKKVFWPMIIGASLVGYSRIYNGKHYPSDVVGGALLGITIGIIVYFVVNKFVLKKQ